MIVLILPKLERTWPKFLSKQLITTSLGLQSDIVDEITYYFNLSVWWLKF